MKHVTSLMSKKHMLLTLLMLLCSMRVAMAANQIITINVATPGTLNTMMGETKICNHRAKAHRLNQH